MTKWGMYLLHHSPWCSHLHYFLYMNTWSDCHKQKSYSNKLKRNKNKTEQEHKQLTYLFCSASFSSNQILNESASLKTWIYQTYQLPYHGKIGQQLGVIPQIENGFIKTMQLSKMIEHLIYFIFRKPRFVCLPAMYYLQMLRKENRQCTGHITS